MSRNEVQTLILVLILAFGLRVSGLGFESLWLDECYQSLIEVYGHPAPDFISERPEPYLFRYAEPADTQGMLKNFSAVDEVCPPLYAVLLNGWMRAFGDSDIAIRLLSCLTSLAGVASVYLVGRSLIGPQAAIYASLLMAISPFDIAYAQEARMYSLCELTAVLSFGSLIMLCRFPSRHFILLLVTYVVATWAMINSHYTTLFIALSGGFWGLLQILRTRSLKLFLALSAAWLSIAVLWLPWLSYFLHVAQVRKASTYVARSATWWWPAYAITIKMPINWLSYLVGRRVALPFVPMYASAAGFILLALQKTFSKNKCLDSMIALWFWVVVPALGIWLSDVLENHKVIEVSRYLIGTAPAIYILCGAGLSYINKHYKFWLYVFVCHMVLATANNTYQHIYPQKEPWRQMAQLVESKVNDEMLFVAQPYDIVCLDRYLHFPRKQIGLSTVMKSEDIAKRVSAYRRFWLITALDGEAVTTRIPNSFSKKEEFVLPRGLILRFYEAAGN